MIIRQTESLNRLVTEFSNFSRLPLPKIELDLCKLTESVILLQKVAKKILFSNLKRMKMHSYYGRRSNA